MAWTSPITVAALQDFLASYWNTYVRDNLNLLKTRIDDDGELKTQHTGISFSAGKQNTSTSETDLHSFTLAADYLANGEHLDIVSTIVLAANGNTKTVKFYVGAQSLTLYTGTASGQVLIVKFRVTRRTSTTCAVTGLATLFPSGGGTVSAQSGYNSGLSSLDFTSSQTCKFTGQGGATGDIIQAEMTVRQHRGNGSAV